MEEVLPSSPIMASSVRQTLGESLGLGKKDVNFVSFKKEQDKATTYYDLHFEVDRSTHTMNVLNSSVTCCSSCYTFCMCTKYTFCYTAAVFRGKILFFDHSQEHGVSKVLNTKCYIILKESQILRKCSICSILSDGKKESKIVMDIENTSHWSKTTQNQRHTVSTNPRLN